MDDIFQTQRKLSFHLLPCSHHRVDVSSVPQTSKGNVWSISALSGLPMCEISTLVMYLCTFETLLIPINVFTLTSLLCTVILHALHYWMKKTLYIWQDFCSTKVTVTFVGQSLSICQCLCLIHQLSLHWSNNPIQPLLHHHSKWIIPLSLKLNIVLLKSNFNAFLKITSTINFFFQIVR